jgi:hypothetical protein
MEWIYDDGGRAEAGFRGTTGDCGTRAIAIATGLPYREVYDLVNQYAKTERASKRRSRKSAARTGIHTPTMRRIMAGLGWDWTPTMHIGAGTTVHLEDYEIPMIGAVVVALSRHYAAVVDGVVRDTGDPSRDGTRCVYGYWTAPEE